MSTLREAAQQALEALEGFLRFAAIHSDGPDASDKYLAEDYAEEAFLKAAKVLPDLRTALEQPPLTFDKLSNALVMSRLIDKDAIENAEEYDDGVTLDQVRAAYRRLV